LKRLRRHPIRTATALLALAGGATGMVATSAASAASARPHAAATVTLTYTLWDPHEEIGYKQSAAAFEKLHPNIKINIEQIAYTSYQTKLQEEFSAGNGPDNFWVNTPWLSTWIKDGLMLNLAPYIKKWGTDMSQYYPSLVALHSYQGGIYGLPKDWDTIALYVNENYMQAHHLTPPANMSWNLTNGGSFLHFLEEATTDTSGNNALSPNFNPNKVAVYALNIDNSAQTGFENFWAEDGVSVIPKAYASSVSFDTQAGIATTQFIRNLMYKWHVAIPGAELGSNGENPNSEDQALFAAGKIAMMMGGDWETYPVYQDVGSKFKIGVVPLPSGPDGRWSVFNGLVDGVNPKSPHLTEALEWEQWLGSAASQKIMGSGGFIWPAIKSLDPLFVQAWKKDGIDMTPFLDEAHGNVVDWPNTPGMNQGLTDMGLDMGPIWLGAGSESNTASLLSKAAAAANHDLAAAGA
jgi:multiple sugar transport system substrate-binding protein